MRGDDGDAALHARTARVAFICTANRARSPFAAALFRAEVGKLPVVVESFGVLDQVGAPALPGAVHAATEFGIDLSGHRAQPLHPGALEGVELAIGFEPTHVAAALAAGVSADRAFLLTELAQILEFDVLPWPEGADSFESRVAHANARRFAGGRLPSAVADPVGGSDRMFRQTYEEIDRMVAIIGLRLFGASGARTG